MTRRLYEQDVKRRVLALREDLVRHDENLAAWHLLNRAVPYFLRADPDIAKARDDQYLMVRHVLPADELAPEDRARDVYADYYAQNPYERPFEEQYGIDPEDAHERLPRVEWLRGRLRLLATGWPGPLRVLDLGANDGWLAVNLAACGLRVEVTCVDLHPDNCRLAERRRSQGAPIADVYEAEALTFLDRTAGLRPYWTQDRWDAVVIFEVVEHVADPEALLDAAARVSRRLFVSTPEGAVEGGALPTWATVEPKGHVRSVTAGEFEALCAAVGTVRDFGVGPDGVMLCEIAPR